MDVEKSSRRASRSYTHEQLADACWTLASNLSGGRWDHPVTQHVSIERSISEVLGSEVLGQDIIVDGHVLEPTAYTTTVQFIAEKSYEAAHEGQERRVAAYIITHTTSQTVVPQELPEDVANLVDDYNQDEYDDDEDEEDYAGDIDHEDEDAEGDEEYRPELQKHLEEVWQVDEEGLMSDHKLSFSYTADGDIIFDTEYIHTWEQPRLKSSIKKPGAVQGELYSAAVEPLTKQGIDEELVDINEKYRDLIARDMLQEMFRLNGGAATGHIQRIMGALGTLQTGIVFFHKNKRNS